MVKVFDDDFCVDIRIELLKEGKRVDVSADYYKNFSGLEYNSEKDAYKCCIHLYVHGQTVSRFFYRVVIPSLMPPVVRGLSCRHVFSIHSLHVIHRLQRFYNFHC